ncbi:MAG: hypothetical protein JW849_10585 [Phycisphaerae bacterium]|nr:hypothetical protein [Phycisphaerae bacterium]
MNLLEPLFLAENRVRGSYRGGLLLERFFGQDSPSDGPRPEDWLASTEPATPDPEAEGLGRICSDDPASPGTSLAELLAAHAPSLLGEEHAAVFGGTLGFHCRLIDTADAQGVGCCPPPAPGKTIYEDGTSGGIGWHVLATRPREGEQPSLLVGLRQGATVKALTQADDENDLQRLVKLMHRVNISAGETYFVPDGTPFVVGPGVFALQISLAGDPENVGPIPLEACLQAVDPEAVTDENLPRIATSEHILRRSDEGFHAELIGSDRTTAFSLWRVEVVSRMHLTLPRPFALVLCIGGEGRMFWSGGARDLHEGDRFVQPFGVPWMEYAARGRLSLLIALPPNASE